MRNNFTKIILISVLAMFTGSVYAGATASMMDQALEPAPDPKKKKAGAECKVSEECQRHHTCSQSGNKSVCTPPPRISIPNT